MTWDWIELTKRIEEGRRGRELELDNAPGISSSNKKEEEEEGESSSFRLSNG